MVGWAMSASLKTAVVLDALHVAATKRRPASSTTRTRGANTARWASGSAARPSACGRQWGSRGNADDNAMAEAFFATLECELLARYRFTSHAEARLAIFRWIEGWFNPHRRHSSLGQRSPITHGRQHLEQLAQTAAAAA